MTSRISMPAMRQVLRDPDTSLWRRLTRLHEPVIYEIAEPYAYETIVAGVRLPLLLPAGFRSDLASTPRLTWIFGFRPDGVLCLPGWYHDFYYRHGFYLAERLSGPVRIGMGLGKTFADQLLAQMTTELAGIRLPGCIARLALTLGGWPAWWRNQQYRDRVAEDLTLLELIGDYHD